MSDEEKTNKQEDDVIDFSEIGKKIKSWFKTKESSSEKKKETNEEDINFSEAIKYLKEHKELVFYFTLIGIIFVGSWLRASSIPNYNGILVGLDEFVFHRYASYIVNNGTLPENDPLRYFPTGFKTFNEQQVLSYMIAGFYYILKIFSPNIPLMTATIWLPVPAFFISMIFFYLMTKELLNKKTALIATTFLCFVPSYIFRTLAGVTDKESVAMIFWFAMTWALIKSLKAKNTKNTLYWGLTSGIIGGLNALTWGGANFLFHSIALSFIILILINKITRRQELTFFTWFIPVIIMNATLTVRYPNILTHDIFMSGTLAGLLIIIKELTYNLFINKIKNKKMPDSFYFIIMLLVLSAIALPIMQFSGIFSITDKINSALATLEHPFGTCAFCVSVSENQEPYFIDNSRGVDWWHSMQWFIPLFIIGSILLVQETLSKFKKDSLIMTFLFALFIIFFMFSKFSTDNAYSTLNTFFSSTYMYTLPLLLIAMVLFAIKYAKRKTAWNELTIPRMLIIIWFGLSIIATRGAIRVMFASTPVFMLAAAYAVTRLEEIIEVKTKDKIYAYTIYVIAIIISIWAFSVTSVSTAGYYSSFTPDWITAMNWVQNNTAPDSVFTHWWDYGYWVQTMGNRATTGDGGNYYGWINEMTGGRMFSGYNLTEVYYSLEAFKDNSTGHMPDYLLIMDDDILKYVQMANIGGRPGFYAPFTYAQRVENKYYMPENYSTALIFQYLSSPGLIGEDVIIQGELFPSDQSYVVNILIPMNDEQLFGNPLAVVYNIYSQKSVIIPYGCVCEYNNGCTNMNLTASLPSCIEFIQGGVVHIPSNLRNRLMTQLYLLNKSIPGFEIAYTTPAELSLQGMLSQGDPTDITIYKINYTEMKKWVDNGSPAW